ncbi:hypothetical protein OIE66_22870 [Nonomuraea sp. NBC_01738]|uniref:Clp protease N-terminal domain-containing protein n=1 Tax=Nonomuraea sp. NBC_01738 TaxID=2976003 RepID=UPI002E0EC164|nr:hypothetical protein OIE66_22870 [Nonomuraea sp. NBC_01738]
MSAIDEYINAIIERGMKEAQADHSSGVEAHHLLLAISVHGDLSTQRALDSAGLGHRAIRTALDQEFEHSLSAVGVSRSTHKLPPATPDGERRPKLAASAMLALERGYAKVARKKDLRPSHLLLGILQAELGTVPRALALAGVDRTELMVRTMAALDEA